MGKKDGYFYNFLPEFSTGVTTFPAFTICPDFDHAYKKDVLARFGLTLNNVRKEGKFPPNLQRNGQNFVDLITHNLTELVAGKKSQNIIFKKIMFSLIGMLVFAGRKEQGTNYTLFSFYNQNYEQQPMDQLTPIYGKKVLPLTLDDWTTKYYQLLGRCFTYTVPDWIRSLNVRSIIC